MADYWTGTGDGAPDFGPPNPNAGKYIKAGLQQLPDVVAQSAAATPSASAPAPIAGPPAAPTRAMQMLPAGIARRSVGDTQIYMGVGAHGEPVFSDTVAGVQNASRPSTARPYTGDALAASDPNVAQRRAVGELAAQDAAGYPGGMIGGVPAQYRQPVAPTDAGPDQTAATRRMVGELRAAPGGDQEWGSNSLGMRAGDALRLAPQQRQQAINQMLAYNASKDADPDTVAANRSMLAQIDQSPRPGAYDPTGFSYRNTVGGVGMGGMNPMEYMRFAAEQGNEQANRELRAQGIKNRADQFNADRADKLDKEAADEIGATAASFNKDNPNDPMARRAAGMQYVLDHFNDPKARGNAAYRQGLNALQAELRLQGTPTWFGRVRGVPDMSQQPLSRFDVAPNHSLFGGPTKTIGPAIRRTVGSDGRSNYVPATGAPQPGDVQYENAGGLFDPYQQSSVLNTLLQRPQNLDSLRQILAQNRKGE